MTGPVVRPARGDDAPVLIAILYETFGDTWAPQMPASSARRFYDEKRPERFVGERGLGFTVAEIDGAVVGFAYWEGDFVQSLHVSAKGRRRGVGRALMGAAEAAIAAAGFARVRLETDTFNGPSQALYAALGYREVDRYPDTENDPSITTVLLEKVLESRA